MCDSLGCPLSPLLSLYVHVCLFRSSSESGLSQNLAGFPDVSEVEVGDSPAGGGSTRLEQNMPEQTRRHCNRTAGSTVLL